MHSVVKLFIVVLCSCAASGAPASTKSEYEGLALLITVKNKSYYSMRNYVTWFEGKQICSSAGMRLATVRNHEEAKALLSVEQALGWGNQYWIGARESQELPQFVWDDTRDGVLAVLPLNTFIDVKYPYNLCLTLHIQQNGSNDTGFFKLQCSKPHGRMGVLCEK